MKFNFVGEYCSVELQREARVHSCVCVCVCVCACVYAQFPGMFVFKGFVYTVVFIGLLFMNVVCTLLDVCEQEKSRRQHKKNSSCYCVSPRKTKKAKNATPAEKNKNNDVVERGTVR